MIGISIVHEFRQLQLIEQGAVDSFLREVNSISRGRMGMLNKLELVGSARQGSFSSSLFNPNCQENGEKICRKLDFDIQGTYQEKIVEPSCLENVQGKLDHVAIRGHCFKSFDIKQWKSNDFIQSYHLKEFVLKSLSRLEEKELKNFKLLLKAYLQSQRRTFQAVDVKIKGIVSKATSQRYMIATIDQRRYLEINMDLALTAETKFSPRVLKEFSERTSYVLPQSVLDHLHIIAKSSHENKFNKSTTEWSYSFCHIENHIFTDVFTDVQTLIYLVGKSIFKKYIEPLDDNLLTSYLMKTISLWHFENAKFSQEDWFDDVMILTQTRLLFENLNRSLRKGVLSSYFIPELNLIERMDKKFIKNVIHTIEIKVLGASFENLFSVEELHEAQNFLQDVESFFSYGREMYDLIDNLFPILIGKKFRYKG